MSLRASEIQNKYIAELKKDFETRGNSDDIQIYPRLNRHGERI